MFKIKSTKREMVEKLRIDYLNEVAHLIDENLRPQLIYADTSQSIDKVYIMGELTEGRLLIYYLGSLEVVRGFDELGMPISDGIIYTNSPFKAFLRNSSLERETVLKAKKIIRQHKNTL